MTELMYAATKDIDRTTEIGCYLGHVADMIEWSQTLNQHVEAAKIPSRLGFKGDLLIYASVNGYQAPAMPEQVADMRGRKVVVSRRLADEGTLSSYIYQQENAYEHRRLKTETGLDFTRRQGQIKLINDDPSVAGRLEFKRRLSASTYYAAGLVIEQNGVYVPVFDIELL